MEDVESFSVSIEAEGLFGSRKDPVPRDYLLLEEGGSRPYTMKLAARPASDVTVTVSGASGTDLSVNPSSLTFTTDNWSNMQTVSVSAATDTDSDDDFATLTHSAAGGGYANVAIGSMTHTASGGYARTSDGFVTSLHDTAPVADGMHRIVFFNPASNLSQQSRLRLANSSVDDAMAYISRVDDTGADSGVVEVAIPAGETVELGAAALENGDGDGDGVTGALGDGTGKWRLEVRSSAPLLVMSLMGSAGGYLTNLSSAPATPGARPDTLGVPLFPAAGGERQGFVRVINRSDKPGTP